MNYELIIIGGGPAGITAGIYAARYRLKTLMITKDFGGQITKKAVPIENYPAFKEISGIELIRKFKEHLDKFKIDIEMDSVIKIERTNGNFQVFTQNQKLFKSKTVIIASGADPRPLKVPGENEFVGRGVSYCVTCDSPLFKNKIVAVIGGGNAGFEAAIALARWAKKIYVLEYGERVVADIQNQELARKTKKVEIITNAALKEIKGDKFVNSIIYEDRKTGQEKKLEVEGVFVEIGSQPASAFAKDLVELNERGEIKVDFETFQTKTPGLFAAGDVNVGKFKQIVTACGEGAKAALAAYDYLQEQK
ncbi:MAG: thioredoxin-disulfide reductase [Candidatus Nealsonbacteria bacterium CG_4_9_14_0_8_um_filter_35_12]|uniref:Thioredoxin-disulfide reductase n=1 Tax=Candidatus Nealsonbacteria bacterium CG_4_9_14_0_8_um_filter_35_12 TaxID=1974692 RepID=A0A2M8DNB5_9BACT|nr:MAG: thioredoxin-disulfide reductase [Candidatus Nealsonbacteria bacterium CG_4_9_14_0_8_um_filter_35_12]